MSSQQPGWRPTITLDVGAPFRALLQAKSYIQSSTVEQPNEPPTGTNTQSADIAPAQVADGMSSQAAVQWRRELHDSLAGRPSRASSIISTRTRFTVNTLQDDSRSIDLDLAGHSFRINRDGSRITTTLDPPPPYRNPEDDQGSTHRDSDFPTGTYYLHTIPRSRTTTRSRSSTQGSRPLRPFTMTPLSTSARITDPREFDMPSPVSPESADQLLTGTGVMQDSPARNRSYKEGAESITVVPVRRQRRTVSDHDIPDSVDHSTFSSPLRRSNGVQLARIVTESDMLTPVSQHGPQSASAISANVSFRHPQSHSAGASFPGGHDVNDENTRPHEPQSPLYYGPNATGPFPSSLVLRGSHTTNLAPQPPPKDSTVLLGADLNANQLPENPTATAAPNDATSSHHDTINTATTDFLHHDTTPEISAHYTSLIRSIDASHRRTLHTRDKELASLRSRLHEMDTIYRQQLKARDLIVDDLKRRLAHVEEGQEVAVEKARNEVEDVWERRWKEQERSILEGRGGKGAVGGEGGEGRGERDAGTDAEAGASEAE